MNTPKGGNGTARRPQVGHGGSDNRQLCVNTNKGPGKNGDLKNGRSRKGKCAKKQNPKNEDRKIEFELPRIRKFTNPPSSQPLTLCMEMEPEKECHCMDVLKAIEKTVPNALERKILRNIQFENINVICGTAQLKNRWLVTVADVKTRDQLLRSGLQIKEENVPLRRHDDIIMEDYSLFLKRKLAPKTMDILNNKAKI